VVIAPWCVRGLFNDWRDAPGYVADDEEASTAVTRSANVHFAESGVS